MLQELRQAPQVLSCQAFCSAAPVISGPDVVCAGGGTTFTVAGLPPGVQISWSVVADVSVTQTSSGNTFTLSDGSAIGLATVLATLNGDCGSFTISKVVSIGKPNPTVRNLAQPGEPTFCVFTAPAVPGAGYRWYVDNRLVADANGIEFEYYFGCRITHVISYEFINDCPAPGARPSASVTGECRPRTQQAATATLYPNPASESVDVHVENADDDPQPLTVRLFDSQGRPRAEHTGPAGQATIRLRTDKLPAGLYFVHILRGPQVLSRQPLQIEK
nr:T9SS type A sorting domain-containing protein [Hymenobacter cyanobacteriorum]